MAEAFMEHPDPDIRQAIVRLSDALCTWERSTGRRSVFIVREGRFVYRALDGKPDVNHDIPDSDLMKMIGG